MARLTEPAAGEGVEDIQALNIAAMQVHGCEVRAAG